MAALNNSSPRLQALQTAVVSGTLTGARSPAFAAELDAAVAVRYDRAAVSLDGLKLVHCRRCGGTGVYHMVSGPSECSGHGRLGVCVDGKSIGPADRDEFLCRTSRRSLEGWRATWSALAALTPVTKGDHTALIRELAHVERHGAAAARADATAAARKG